jgi:tight adherence protein B
VAEAAKRRKSVQDSLKELDQKQKTKDVNVKKPPLKVQIRQAGMTVTLERFYLYSAICGLVLAAGAYLAGAPLLVVPGALVAGALGLPRWFVSFRRGLRVKAFLKEFPNALDIIVRAIKSGLPLNDGIRLIANESPEPVRAEFRRIVDSQQLGMSIPDAALRMQETMPCPEAGFFGIVIQIQAQAGGNLSEALGNLSRVLRDRKKMKDKVQALSMEAKASAAIIGALPFIVAVMVYLTSPNYIMPLFTTNVGNLILGISGLWMLMGVLVMRKMMNFEV